MFMFLCCPYLWHRHYGTWDGD